MLNHTVKYCITVEFLWFVFKFEEESKNEKNQVVKTTTTCV